MNGLRILYWVLAILGLLYLLGFSLCLFSLADFSSRLKKRLNALAILFSEKRDVLLSLDAYYRKTGLTYSSADKEALAFVSAVPSKNIKDIDVKATHDTLASLEKRLRYLGDSNSWIQQGDEFAPMMSLLSDLSSNYRRIIAVYNSDLLGYEYWRKQPLYRLWFFLLGFRAKKRLS